MPNAAPRPCATPGCSEKVKRGHCQKHARAVEKQRGTRTQRGYDNDWARLSKEHLKKEPLCRTCKGNSRVTAAELVDHIIPWQSGATDDERNRLRMDRTNLQSLCWPCHNTKTVTEREARRRGEGGSTLYSFSRLGPVPGEKRDFGAEGFSGNPRKPTTQGPQGGAGR